VWAAASQWQVASMLAGLTSRASHASSFGTGSASRRSSLITIDHVGVFAGVAVTAVAADSAIHPAA
jgi:hypothetical protein